MVQVDYHKWNQSPELLREYALRLPHRRTRERFMALYEMTQGKNATQIAAEIERRAHTVFKWAHTYNRQG